MGNLLLGLAVGTGILAVASLFLRRAGRARFLVAALGALVTAGLGAASLRARRVEAVRQRAQDRYIAGIDERDRGNLEAAEREFREAIRIDPGHSGAREEMARMEGVRPAEEREQARDTRVDPAATAGNGPGRKPEPEPHKASPFEIVHYAWEGTLLPDRHSLDAVATVRIRSRGGSVPQIDLSLNPEFRPSAVSWNGQPVPFRHTKDLLAVTPATPLQPGQEGVLVVTYGRRGPALLKASGDQIAPEGTYLRSESRWYPATGELDFRAPVRVRVALPAEYYAVSVGALRSLTRRGDRRVFHWETDRLASMVSLAAARYTQKTLTLPAGGPPGTPGVRDVPLRITCYTFPEHADRAGPFLDEAGRIVRYFERLFGPYPYEKLGVVEIPRFPGGYGTTSFVMLIDAAFAAEKVDREFLAHEIAHQWWGNSVFPQGLGAAWLTEAFANYGAWLYEAARAGNPRVLQRRVARGTTKYLKGVALKGDQAIAETDPYAPVGAPEVILYEKGAVILHMLRHEMGDGPFFRLLRSFADRNRFGKSTIESFRAAAEAEAGRPLAWFFDQWLGRRGAMRLTYSFSTVPETPQQNQAVLTIRQEGEPYRARLAVLLDVENRVQRHLIELSRPEETFRFPVRARLTNVLIDPDRTHLMRRPRWVVP